MGMQTEATVSWGLHLDCDEVLAIIKALEEQEKEQIEQEKEKQHEEKNVQDNDSSSFPTEKVEGFLSDLVPKDLMWHIVYDPDSEEGPTVIICDRSSTSVERRGYQNYGWAITSLGNLIKRMEKGEPNKKAFEEVEKLLLFEKAGIEVERDWLLALSIS